MDVMEAIRCRRSVRRYSDRPIPEDVLNEMREALRLAPSACNNQPWRFVFVTEASLRKDLAEACNGQAFVGEAPVVVAGVGLPDRAYGRMGGSRSSVEVDVAIALDHLTLAAAARGLGTCWIGAFDEAAVGRLLGAPRPARVVALTPLGYPASPDLIRPEAPPRREPAEVVILRERFPET